MANGIEEGLGEHLGAERDIVRRGGALEKGERLCGVAEPEIGTRRGGAVRALVARCELARDLPRLADASRLRVRISEHPKRKGVPAVELLRQLELANGVRKSIRV